jgi:hypothetical protein
MANEKGLLLCWSSVFDLPTTEARLKNQSTKLIQMLNSIPSDRYVADKRFAAHVYSVSQYSRKLMLPAAHSYEGSECLVVLPVWNTYICDCIFEKRKVIWLELRYTVTNVIKMWLLM